MQICEVEKCTGCAACYGSCNKDAITMSADKEGFPRPVIDEKKCVSCGKCGKVCPVVNPQPEQAGQPNAFAAYNINEEERLASSSGGLFTVFAKYVLENGGVVFGAAFDEQFGVSHICVQREEDLYKLQGSKYLQSEIRNTYFEAKQILQQGRMVLFTGTPCQIEGLLCFLGKNYDNLYTQDLICHGVPSPMVWKKYVKYREKNAGAPVRRTFFRHKKYGWKRYALSLEFAKDEAYLQIFGEDLYMKSFLRNFSLRPSCYDCQFKKLHRLADITLADFWEIEKVAPEMDDDKGTSLAIIHTEKGQKLWEAVQTGIIQKEVAIQDALKGNPSMTTSVSKPLKRDLFMKAIRNKRFDKCIDEYVIPKAKKNFRYLLRRYLRRLLGDTFVEKVKRAVKR